MDNNNNILATLLYSDLFDYPLTKEELWYYLHIDHAIEKKVFEKLLSAKRGFDTDGQYYFLPKRKNIVKRRESLKALNEKKIQYAKKIIDFLHFIPTIDLIGISGSVAMKSGEKDADIDLFILAHAGTMWLTRFVVVFFLRILGIARRRKSKQSGNLFCTNMFLGSFDLTFSQQRQTFYTAHELAQLMVLFDRDNWYSMLLQENAWMKRLLYNAFPVHHTSRIKKKVWYFLVPLEFVAKKIQLWYIQKHQTHEEVTDHLLAFHPHPYDVIILKKYEQRRKAYGL